MCIQPRRIAARSLAYRVSKERAQNVGDEVGYRVRFDRKISSKTKIEYVSRGVFLREILSDPHSLNRYHAVLLDEFHERQLEIDWIFGLLLSQRENFPHLRVGVFSATLDPRPIQTIWSGSRLITVKSPLYPVHISHQKKPGQFDTRLLIERSITAALESYRSGQDPDYLIFLPGYREIHRVIDGLRHQKEFRDWDVVPLSGEQSPEEQDQAIRQGLRPRIVVATNLAESSLTVEGIRTVIDSGLARRMDYDPARGINHLRTVRISSFSAKQRTGRAGRIGPGTCIRLWSEPEEESLPEQDSPECQRLDLADWYLRSVASSQLSPSSFPWIDSPPGENIEHAKWLLQQLGAIDADQVTALGHRLLAHPVHPRIAILLEKGAEKGASSTSALLAALIEEDPIFQRGSDAEDHFVEKTDQADFFADIRALNSILQNSETVPVNGLRRRVAHRVIHQARRLQISHNDERDNEETLRRVCLAAYPDRIARLVNRGTATYQSRDGTFGRIDRNTRIQPTEWILALEKRELMVKGTRTVVLSSIVNLSSEWILEDLAQSLCEESAVEEDSSGQLLEQNLIRLDHLVVQRNTLGKASADIRASYFAESAMTGGIPLRQWNDSVNRWIARVECLRHYFPEYEVPYFDEAAKRTVLEWVAFETTTLKQFRNAEILPTLKNWMSRELRALLPTMIPEHFSIPKRKKPVFIDYTEPVSPSVSLRIQEAFSLDKHPSIADGRCPLTVHLLAPNHRPVQTTQDLQGFWANSYPAIRKELRGRYPKHEWPEKP